MSETETERQRDRETERERDVRIVRVFTIVCVHSSLRRYSNDRK